MTPEEKNAQCGADRIRELWALESENTSLRVENTRLRSELAKSVLSCGRLRAERSTSSDYMGGQRDGTETLIYTLLEAIKRRTFGRGALTSPLSALATEIEKLWATSDEDELKELDNLIQKIDISLKAIEDWL